MILESKSFQDALDQLHYLGRDRETGQADRAGRSRTARDQVHTARERTKTIRARVHSETQVVAVRTQQQRNVQERAAREPGLARRQARQAEGPAGLDHAKQEKAFIAEANALAAQDSRIRGQLAAAAGRVGHDAVAHRA